jgi:hypothetical protein
MTNPPSTPNLLDPTQASPALTAGDAERISTAIEAELAPSTRQMYAGAWRQWERWCQGRGLQALPASPEALAAFLAERAEAGLTFGTLDGYCSGIAHPHHQQGLPDPTADIVVRRVRRGLRRIMGVAPRRQAYPLTVPELGQIVAFIDTDSAIGVRDRAVILIGYASAMSRPSTSKTSSPSRPASSSPSADPRPTRMAAVSLSVSLAATTGTPIRSGHSTTGSRSVLRCRARSSPA